VFKYIKKYLTLKEQKKPKFVKITKKVKFIFFRLFHLATLIIMDDDDERSQNFD